MQAFVLTSKVLIILRPLKIIILCNWFTHKAFLKNRSLNINKTP